MATLVLTPEEEAAALWTDLDDAALGAVLRKKIAYIQSASHQMDRAVTTAAALLLCCGAAEVKADEMTMRLDGLTQAGRPFGDWVVTVRRAEPPAAG